MGAGAMTVSDNYIARSMGCAKLLIGNLSRCSNWRRWILNQACKADLKALNESRRSPARFLFLSWFAK